MKDKSAYFLYAPFEFLVSILISYKI